MEHWEYDRFKEKIMSWGIDPKWVLRELDQLTIEVPSWGFSQAGTRFATFHEQGAARNFVERVDDCEQVLRYTGSGGQICMHIPWDKCDYQAAREYVLEKHMTFGTLNTNMFEDDDFRYGTLANAEERIREKTVGVLNNCIDVARTVGAGAINVWTIDGSDIPGQNDYRQRRRWMLESLRKSYEHMEEADIAFCIEYKLFEPSSYHNDIADWGTALYYAEKLGEKAKVTVDLGHHAFGTNVAQIVSLLLDEGRLGAFHLNDNNCADDDLIPGTINPFRLFAVENEMVGGLCCEETRETTRRVVQGIDTSFYIEPKIPAMIRSVLNVQEAYAKALIVDRKTLKERQMSNDILGANACLKKAFDTDVTPLLEYWRSQKGIEGDPMSSYLDSQYAKDRLNR